MNRSRKSRARSFAVNVLRTLEAPMRSQGQSYRSLDGLHADRDVVAWYWKLTAVASSIMILGGYACEKNMPTLATKTTFLTDMAL
jgi:hypothetical protein